MKKILLFVVGCLIPQISLADIQVVDRFQVYEPIVASSTEDADLYIWDVRGTNSYYPSTMEVDNGKTLHIWSKPGKYQIHLKTISVDWESKKVQYLSFVQDIEIISPEPTPPTPPGPGPGPDPKPNPTGFEGKIQVALQTVPSNAISHKKVVGQIYQSIAAEAAANPSAWGPASMMNEVKVRNLSNFPSLEVGKGWNKFWQGVAKAFVEEKLDSNDLAGHVEAFNKIANVLGT